MKYHEMSKNYIFREFECGLTKEQTAELCFKSVRTVTEWDKGKPIPPECRRLMRIKSGSCISEEQEWDGFKVSHGKLLLPTGQYVTPQQILTGIALMEINSSAEQVILREILKYVRAISKLKKG